jgi:hypothetical protein
MPILARRLVAASLALLVLAAASAPAALAQSRQLAPGFTALSKDSKVVLTPLDVELFEVTAGGVLEPKADWTAAATTHMRAALQDSARALGLGANEMDAAVADDHAPRLHLLTAVSRSIALHHTGMLPLPTKDGKLDWSLGDTLQPLAQATGARYALFTWVRDSYTSAERAAMMVGLALLGIGVGGGVQVGYAMLVDLDTGRVLWFNQLVRASGDLRQPAPAAETVKTLLAGFPSSR